MGSPQDTKEEKRKINHNATTYFAPEGGSRKAVIPISSHITSQKENQKSALNKRGLRSNDYSRRENESFCRGARRQILSKNTSTRKAARKGKKRWCNLVLKKERPWPSRRGGVNKKLPIQSRGKSLHGQSPGKKKERKSNKTQIARGQRGKEGAKGWKKNGQGRQKSRQEKFSVGDEFSRFGKEKRTVTDLL